MFCPSLSLSLSLRFGNFHSKSPQHPHPPEYYTKVECFLFPTPQSGRVIISASALSWPIRSSTNALETTVKEYTSEIRDSGIRIAQQKRVRGEAKETDLEEKFFLKKKEKKIIIRIRIQSRNQYQL